MSGVYIKWMQMPENCYDCPFGADVDIGVGVAHGCNLLKDFAQYADERHPDCPLIPVPDHGDLIDRNEYERVVRANSWTNPAVPIAVNMIADRMPTIIPADKEGEA